MTIYRLRDDLLRPWQPTRFTAARMPDKGGRAAQSGMETGLDEPPLTQQNCRRALNETTQLTTRFPLVTPG